MKKYQLKFEKRLVNGTEFKILVESDMIYDILRFITLKGEYYYTKYLSLWMDGKVLE